MGVSTNGQICFGILFEEDYEFPWNDEEYDNDIDNWWRKVRGYEPPFALYDSAGGYIGGVEPTKEKVSEYFAHARAWDALNPLPVELINVCSCDYGIYMLAIKSTEMTARRGSPKKFEPSKLSYTEKELADLLAFTDEFGLQGEGPAWYLSSLWC